MGSDTFFQKLLYRSYCFNSRSRMGSDHSTMMREFPYN